MKTEETNYLLSVITVCFNAEKTIEKTLQSVLSQIFQNFEYIIIDGGSTDATLSIISKYADHPSIKWFSEKDRGIYDAMNKGIQKATGSFLHFLNADDVLVSRETYQKIIPYLQNKEIIYYGKLKYSHQDGRVRFLGHPLQKDDLRYGLKGIHQPATFFPRTAFQRQGMFDLKYRISSDYDLIRRFCMKEKNHFVNEVVVEMADGGASAVQIRLACAESRAISIFFGESQSKVLYRELLTRVGLFLRRRWPSLFHLLLGLKKMLIESKSSIEYKKN